MIFILNMKIAFGYKMGVGKDEAVSYLVQKYGGTKISFSKPLYDIMYYVQDKCGFPREKDRKFLQYIGTEWARSKDRDIWVNLLLKKEYSDNQNYYITDLRFPNEYQALKNSGWTCVKIIRSHQEERKGTGSHSHTSETALDKVYDNEWDYIIDNTGSLNAFYTKLDNLVNKINKE